MNFRSGVLSGGFCGGGPPAGTAGQLRFATQPRRCGRKRGWPRRNGRRWPSTAEIPATRIAVHGSGLPALPKAEGRAVRPRKSPGSMKRGKVRHAFSSSSRGFLGCCGPSRGSGPGRPASSPLRPGGGTKGGGARSAKRPRAVRVKFSAISVDFQPHPGHNPAFRSLPCVLVATGNRPSLDNRPPPRLKPLGSRERPANRVQSPERLHVGKNLDTDP